MSRTKPNTKCRYAIFLGSTEDRHMSITLTARSYEKAARKARRAYNRCATTGEGLARVIAAYNRTTHYVCAAEIAACLGVPSKSTYNEHLPRMMFYYHFAMERQR